jgi:hypothetical protein
VLAVVCGGATASVVAGAVPAAVGETPASTASTAGSAQPAFVVAPHADGNATVTLRVTFDLTVDDQATVFQQLEANASRLETRFADRMQSVAATTGQRTDRNMTVANVSSRTYVAANTDATNTGVVELSVTWVNLAVVADDRLRLGEPFTSEFQPDRRFVVVVPTDYRLAGVTPQPTTQTADRLAWAAGANLSGFRVTLQPTETTPSETATPEGSPTTESDDPSTETDDSPTTPTDDGSSTPGQTATTTTVTAQTDGPEETAATETTGPTPLPAVLLAVAVALVVVVKRRVGR